MKTIHGCHIKLLPNEGTIICKSPNRTEIKTEKKPSNALEVQECLIMDSKLNYPLRATSHTPHKINQSY